jgi:3-oxoacyl-[acyl-carrier-protein] synthase-3
MTLAGHLIDSGQIDYAMIVDGEDAGEIRHNTVARLLRPETTRADFLSEFPSLTLGAGAAAAVIGRTSDHPEGHRILGGVTRAATQHHELCIGDVDGMFTDTKELLRGGMELVVDAWKEAAQDDWEWSDMDRYILHQVSDVHTNAIVKAAKLDKSRVPLTYPRYGNVGPASIPITLADQADSLSRGDRVLCMGVGSGLNTAMTEILW